MKKVFWEDPYLTTLKAAVVAINGCEVLFNETIIYSFSGGQESDKAFVNEYPVLSSRMENGLIYYTIPEKHNLRVGDLVVQTIDWPRRYNLMRLHFCAEIILELVTQKYKLEKVGAHISQEKSRIDFIYDKNISHMFAELEAAFKKIIDADLLIEKGWVDKDAQRRFWKIEGFAQVPCGGTHVKSTREVGYVKLKREHPGKNIERIEIRLIS